MARDCKECGKNMKKTASINSANAILETWKCEECGFQEQICSGLKQF